jgi:PASTA domain-containing protein
LRDEDLSDGADDHVGEPLPEEPTRLASTPPQPVKPSTGSIMPASMKQTIIEAKTAALPELPDPNPAPARGTVIIDVESGQVVPSLVGLPLRSAVATAQQAGFELAILGNGVAREQSPPAGARVPAGSKIAVRFTR